MPDRYTTRLSFAERRRGLYAQTEQYENLIEAGVIDPTKVVRSALPNAASIASLLLTTEAVISLLPEGAKVGVGPGAGGRVPEMF